MNAFYLIHMPIVLGALGRWAAARNLGWTVRRAPDGRTRDAGLDEGCALHHLLTETFGKAVLQPFRLLVPPGGRQASLYAYSPTTAEALRQAAASFALPEAADVLRLAELADKAMPATWETGRRLAFDLRVRPTKRLLKPLPLADGSIMAKGCEADAFLVDALRRFPIGGPDTMQSVGLSREAVYRNWLVERFGVAAQLDCDATHLVRFARSRIARKDYAPEGPDAVLQGEMIVRDPEAFMHLLQRGLGRHTAYGYGMILLRPAGRPSC